MIRPKITKEQADNFVYGIDEVLADFDGYINDWFREYAPEFPRNWPAFFREVADALEGEG